MFSFLIRIPKTQVCHLVLLSVLLLLFVLPSLFKDEEEKIKGKVIPPSLEFLRFKDEIYLSWAWKSTISHR